MTYYDSTISTFLQLSPDNVPTDNLDPLALSIMQELGSKSTTVSEAREDALVKQYITEGMTRANQDSVSRAAKVQASLMRRESLL